MGTKAVFVGVNKHQDPTIPELSGTRPPRDERPKQTFVIFQRVMTRPCEIIL